MMRTHVDNRILAEANERDRLDRIYRILEVLEAGDRPRFNFYAHQHRADEREVGAGSDHLEIGGGGHRRHRRRA